MGLFDSFEKEGPPESMKSPPRAKNEAHALDGFGWFNTIY